MDARITAGILLFFVLVAVLAWMSNSVGGAGFLHEFVGIFLSLVALIAVFAGAMGVVYLIGVLIFGSWNLASW